MTLRFTSLVPPAAKGHAHFPSVYLLFMIL